jgi:hypothetical protein
MRDFLFFKRDNPYFKLDKICIRFMQSEISGRNSVEWVQMLDEAARRFGRMMKISMNWTEIAHSPFDIRELPGDQRQLEIIRSVNNSIFRWIENK